MAKRIQKPQSKMQVPLPAADRRTALVVIGDGMGNIIQQSPLLVAASSWFEQVDLWLPRSPINYAVLLRDTVPNLHRVMTGPASPEKTYDAGFSTWLVRAFRNKIPARIRFATNSPQTLRMTESSAAVQTIRKAGWEGDDPFPVCASKKPKLDLPGSPLIGVTTGSLLTERWESKRYAGKNYAKVFDLILEKHPGASFIHVGTKSDSDIDHPQVIDLRDVLPLLQVAGAISRCCVFLGNDTGLVHVAAALFVPTVVLFGPTRIKKNLPPHNAKAVSLDLPCQPCQDVHWFRMPGSKTECNRECLRDLSPRQVANAVLEEL